MPTHFPQPVQPPFEIVTVIGMFLILAVLVFGVVMLRPRRTAQVWDGMAWIAFGLIVNRIFFFMMSHPEVIDLTYRCAKVAWGLVLFGCLMSFVRVALQSASWQWLQWLGLTVGTFVPLFCVFAPNIEQGREEARFVQCRINLRKIGQAIHSGRNDIRASPKQDVDSPSHSWRVALLPYLDQQELHSRYQFEHTWDSPENEDVAKTVVFDYICPSYNWEARQRSRKPTCFAALTGPHAVWSPDGTRQLNDIPDGASQTAMVVEACGLNIVWTEPRDIDVETTPVAINLPGDTPDSSPAMFSSFHPRGVHVLMADGNVRRVPLHTDPKILQAMITADGGENLP